MNGQLFWKTSFAAKENVPFREFCMRFFNQFEALKGKMPPGTLRKKGFVLLRRLFAFSFSSLFLLFQRKKRRPPCQGMLAR